MIARPILAAMLALALAGSAMAQERWTLTVLHTNDFHSRLQPINRFDVTCSAREIAERQCAGGTARLVTKVREIRQEAALAGRGVLLLDGGDQFQGSLLYTHHRGAAELQGMKMVGYDAMTLGNHEFDNGPEVLARFIEGASTGRAIAVVSANVDASRDRHLRDLVRPYAVIEVAGRQVGVIGLTTETTSTVSSPGRDIRLRPALEAAREAVAALSRDGITSIIAVTHLGLPDDLDLARAVPGIDLVVGGHSHTLLSNTLPGAAGPYPVIATAADGTAVPVVQAGSGGRYLGRIDVTFDGAGKVVAWTGDTIALDDTVAEDGPTREAVAVLAAPVEAMRREEIGAIATTMDPAPCRVEECLLGNLVAEAMLWATRDQGVTIAIQNGGGLRAPLRAGSVTVGDVLTVLPFQNTLATARYRGRDIRAALEIGVSQAERNAGRFPQVAGLRFDWNPNAPGGRRVGAIELREADDRFAPLEPERLYTLATNNFMRAGGDDYTVLRDGAIDAYDHGANLEVVVMDYIRANTPVRVSLDGRIARR